MADPTKRKQKYRRIEFHLTHALAAALDDYRASKRPIPLEGDAMRFLLTEALISEGFEPGDANDKG